MKLTETPMDFDLESRVVYTGSYPYLKDLVTGERHPVTSNGYEMTWRVWVVDRSRLWLLAEAGRIYLEPVSFENQHQSPFFLQLGDNFRISYNALKNSKVDNLEWIEYVEKKKVEYQNFLKWVKDGQKLENFV